jgi:hypothetical protein
VIAVASDVPLETAPAAWLDLNDAISVARFAARQLGLSEPDLKVASRPMSVQIS